MRYSTITVCCAMLLVLAMAVPATAQRGGRGGGRGGGFGGGFGGFGGGGGGDFRTRMIENLDANRNGYIEPSEMQQGGGASRFIEQMAERAGMSTNRPIQISRLIAASNSGGRGDRGGRDRGSDENDARGRGDRGNNRESESSDDALYVKVPRFGDDQAVGFGLHPRLLAGRIVNLEAEYDERILDFVERTMDRSDENGDSILSREEWEDVRWRDADPGVADVDKDGNLTLAELASLYQQQMQDRGGRGGRGGRGDQRGGRGRGGRGDDDERGGRFAAFGGGFGGFGGGDGEGFGRGGFGGGGGGGRGGRGRGRGDDEEEDGGGRRRGFDPTQMLARFDQNEDGLLDPDEVGERGAFLAERFQIDFSQPVLIQEIADRIANQMGEGGRPGQRRQVEQAKVENPPAFIVEGSHGLAGANAVSGASHLGQRSYRSQQTRSQEGLPNDWKEDDTNGDGQIVLSEYLGGTEATFKLTELTEEFARYDTNGDGIITPAEARRAN